MVDPEFLAYRLNLLEVHKELQESILRDISRRFFKTDFTVTKTAAWQAEKLQQSGMVYGDILKYVAGKSGKSKKEVQSAFKAAETEVFNYDDAVIEGAGYNAEKFKSLSPKMATVYTAALKKTTAEVANLTMTTANTGQSLFIQACDLAHMQVTSGAFSVQEAIKNAIKSAARQGVTVIYPSGYVSSLDAAVRRAVLTGVNQTCGRIQEMRAYELDADIMELSAHFGARPSHAEWQGQLVSRSGKKGYLTLDDIGYGRVDGFMGANCRHDWYIYFEGLSKRNYTPEQLDEFKNATVTYNGEEMSAYAGTQKQRAIERGIRQSKQTLVMYDEAAKNAATAAEKLEWKRQFSDEAVKLKGKEAKLKDFCSQTGLNRDRYREQVFAAKTEKEIKNWGKSVSQKAVWADRKAVDKSGGSGIINYAKANDLFKVEGNIKRITPTQVFDDLQTSKMGQEIARVLDTLPRVPVFDYDTVKDGVKAKEVQGAIKIYMQNCKDVKTATCALIHEMTHYRYGIGQSQWSECVCVCQELKHRRQRDYLTFAEKRMVVKAVKDVYPEYNWRKGGLIHGRRVN